MRRQTPPHSYLQVKYAVDAREQFHLTHVYAKLGVGSRVELATQFRDNEESEEIAGSATAPVDSGP